MELRLKIWELLIIVLAKIASGIMVGMMLLDKFPLASGVLFLIAMQFPTIIIIVGNCMKKPN